MDLVDRKDRRLLVNHWVTAVVVFVLLLLSGLEMLLQNCLLMAGGLVAGVPHHRQLPRAIPLLAMSRQLRVSSPSSGMFPNSGNQGCKTRNNSQVYIRAVCNFQCFISSRRACFSTMRP